jgi:hypothetical protein
MTPKKLSTKYDHTQASVNFQPYAQNSLLIYIYNTFIKILYMFRAVCCSPSEGLNCIYKLNSVALVWERTIPTEWLPPVDEVSANFCR